jgi:hypothetical protein
LLSAVLAELLAPEERVSELAEIFALISIEYGKRD